jgi:hypothetical protein
VRNLVLRSIEASSGERCIDIFRRSDGSFGFEECRRDPEDPRGWSALGRYASLTFTSEAVAIDAACAQAPWLNERLSG